MFRYLAVTLSYALPYKGNLNDLRDFFDVSLADCKGSLTTCGYAIQLFGHFWKTLKLCRVALSTCEAACVAMNKTYQELVALNR